MTEYLNTECTSLTGWSAFSTYTFPTAVTFDSRTAFYLNSGSVAPKGSGCERNVGTIGSALRLKIVVYPVAIGLVSNSDTLNIYLYLGTFNLHLIFSSEGLFYYNGSNYIEIGTNIVDQGAWQEFDFYFSNITSYTAMTLTALFKNGIRQNGAPISSVGRPSGGTMGRLVILQYGNTTNNQISYLDSILLSEALLISGTLYEKESDAVGSAEQYLIINPATGAVLAAGTAEADGAFEVHTNFTTEYALIMPDKDGTYQPTCLNHYITGVSL